MLKAVVQFDSGVYGIVNENRERFVCDNVVAYKTLRCLVRTYSNTEQPDLKFEKNYFNIGLSKPLIAFETEEELVNELAEYLI